MQFQIRLWILFFKNVKLINSDLFSSNIFIKFKIIVSLWSTTKTQICQKIKNSKFNQEQKDKAN